MSTLRSHRSGVFAAGVCLVLLAAPALPRAAEDAATPPPLADASGEQVYRQICQCGHMPDGAGAVGAGSYPAFAGNPNLASSRYLAIIVLNGRRNMPAFRQPAQQDFFFEPTWLSDQQVADVVNYLRSEFGGITGQAITAEEVAALKPP